MQSSIQSCNGYDLDGMREVAERRASKPKMPRHPQEHSVPYKTIDGITSSIIPFCIEEGIVCVLLGQRGAESKAFANAWCLIGGFLDPGVESLEQCAARELREETGLEVPPDAMKLVTVQSDPRRDPRGQIVDTVWSCRLPSRLPAAAADDLQNVAWRPLNEALAMQLAFDHHESLQRFAAMERFLPGL
jgi:8-oxo-dGTP diphosphatase